MCLIKRKQWIINFLFIIKYKNKVAWIMDNMKSSTIQAIAFFVGIFQYHRLWRSTSNIAIFSNMQATDAHFMPHQPSSSRKEEWLSYRNNVINEIKRYLNVQLDSEATLPNPSFKWLTQSSTIGLITKSFGRWFNNWIISD